MVQGIESLTIRKTATEKKIYDKPTHLNNENPTNQEVDFREMNNLEVTVRLSV